MPEFSCAGAGRLRYRNQGFSRGGARVDRRTRAASPERRQESHVRRKMRNPTFFGEIQVFETRPTTRGMDIPYENLNTQINSRFSHTLGDAAKIISNTMGMRFHDLRALYGVLTHMMFENN